MGISQNSLVKYEKSYWKEQSQLATTLSHRDPGDLAAPRAGTTLGSSGGNECGVHSFQVDQIFGRAGGRCRCVWQMDLLDRLFPESGPVYRYITYMRDGNEVAHSTCHAWKHLFIRSFKWLNVLSFFCPFIFSFLPSFLSSFLPSYFHSFLLIHFILAECIINKWSCNRPPITSVLPTSPLRPSTHYTYYCLSVFSFLNLCIQTALDPGATKGWRCCWCVWFSVDPTYTPQTMVFPECPARRKDASHQDVSKVGTISEFEWVEAWLMTERHTEGMTKWISVRAGLINQRCTQLSLPSAWANQPLIAYKANKTTFSYFQRHKTVPTSQNYSIVTKMFQYQKDSFGITKLFQTHKTVAYSQNFSAYILPVITNTITYTTFDSRFDSIIAGTNKRFLETLVDNPDACFAHYCIEYDRVWIRVTHKGSDISRSSQDVIEK